MMKTHEITEELKPVFCDCGCQYSVGQIDPIGNYDKDEVEYDDIIEWNCVQCGVFNQLTLAKPKAFVCVYPVVPALW